jgi:hypothetical protein
MRSGSRSSLWGFRCSTRLVAPFVLALLVGGGVLAGCGGVTTSTSAAAATTVAAAQASTSTAAPTTTTAAPPTTTTEAPTTTTEASTTTTAAPTTTTTIPPDPAGWTRFTAGGISVALPSTFKGGAFGGTGYSAGVKRLADWKTWQENIQNNWQDYDWIMGMFGKAAQHWVPVVVVMRRDLAPDTSLAELTLRQFGTPPAGVTLTPGEKTPTRETYTLVLPDRPEKGTTETDYFVFVLSGDQVYAVVYSGSSINQWKSLKAAYEQSAGLIRVTAPTEGTDLATETTTSTSGS